MASRKSPMLTKQKASRVRDYKKLYDPVADATPHRLCAKLGLVRQPKFRMSDSERYMLERSRRKYMTPEAAAQRAAFIPMTRKEINT